MQQLTSSDVLKLGASREGMNPRKAPTVGEEAAPCQDLEKSGREANALQTAEALGV